MTAPAAPSTVIVYSNDPKVREEVRSAVGRRPAADLGRVEWVECATNDELVSRVDRRDADLVILDGEAQPTGGMGLSRQLKYEIDDCPPICVLLGRGVDRWLATWALADGTLVRPLDPVAAAQTVAQLLRDRARGVPVVR